MRSPKEIIDRIEAIYAEKRIFEFESSDLIYALPFKYAKPLINAETTEEYWTSVYLAVDEEVLTEITDYMPFALQKARNERGLSAIRSLDRMRAWIWLLAEDELLAEVRLLGERSDYGRAALYAICDKFNLSKESNL